MTDSLDFFVLVHLSPPHSPDAEAAARVVTEHEVELSAPILAAAVLLEASKDLETGIEDVDECKHEAESYKAPQCDEDAIPEFRRFDKSRASLAWCRGPRRGNLGRCGVTQVKETKLII